MGGLNTYSGILLCGCKGTRLRELTRDQVLKPLLKIGGKELIRYSIDLLEPDIVTKLVFALDYKADQMKKWVSKTNLPYTVEFSEQHKPSILEAVREASKRVNTDSIIFCNTDEIRERLSLKEVIRGHEASNKLATVVGTDARNLFSQGVLEIKEDGTVTDLRFKDKKYELRPLEIGLVTTGFMVMKKIAVDYFDPRIDLNMRGITAPLIKMGELRVHIDQNIVFFNSNTPEQFYEARDYLMKDSDKY
ncbi:MAG: nucleotidyltransferase family protein [Candidatus Micrarchaeales archaeon]